MWTWLQNNHGSVSAVASIATLAIWTLYFQILLMSYRRTLRPKILINQGAGHRLQAHCLVANMSAEPIYLEAVLIDLSYRRNGDEALLQSRCSLSDLEIDSELNDTHDRRPQWFQGPLGSSEWLDIGTYQNLIDKALERRADPDDVLDLTITIVATYTAEDTLVAARRSFDIEEDCSGKRLSSRHFTAEQIRSSKDRRAIERAMRQEQ